MSQSLWVYPPLRHQASTQLPGCSGIMTHLLGHSYHGVIKVWRGAFGFITCEEVTSQFEGRDVFVHKNDINAIPINGSFVTFRLTKDAKGHPKAEEALVQLEDSLKEAKSMALVQQLDVKLEGSLRNWKYCSTADGRQEATTGGGIYAQAIETDIRRAALMLTRGAEILVVREAKDRDGILRWSDLGGKVENGESALDCAIRELKEESAGFLSKSVVNDLEQGLRLIFGVDGSPGPEVVILSGKGSKTQAVAVFPMDCDGIGIQIQPRQAPNAHGVHAMAWLNQAEPDLRNRECTRWPLLRTVCHLSSRGRKLAETGILDAETGTEEEGRPSGVSQCSLSAAVLPSSRCGRSRSRSRNRNSKSAILEYMELEAAAAAAVAAAAVAKLAVAKAQLGL